MREAVAERVLRNGHAGTPSAVGAAMEVPTSDRRRQRDGSVAIRQRTECGARARRPPVLQNAEKGAPSVCGSVLSLTGRSLTKGDRGLRGHLYG